jgi:hypothetical protein
VAVHLPRKVETLGALKLSLTDIERIYERLQQQVHAQADAELATLVKKPEHTVDEFVAEKGRLRDQVFRVTVTLGGADGKSLYGDDVTVFRSPIRPNEVSSIFMTNSTLYRNATQRDPANMFKLYLDFSKPPLLDSQNPVSSPTPNASNLDVTGTTDASVAAVVDAVEGVTKDRGTNRAWMHRAFMYDLGVSVFGLPLGFYVCWKASSLVAQFAGVNTFFAAAAYVYIFFVTLWAFRLLFGYTRWAFPSVELTDNPDKSRTHRAVLGVIVLGLLVNFIWEFGPLIL